MSEPSKTKACAKCGKTVILTDSGWVHQGGGMYEQYCRDCGWRGGQIGSFQVCPQCRTGVALVDDHTAS